MDDSAAGRVPLPPLDPSGCAGADDAAAVRVRREVAGWGWGLWPQMAGLLGRDRPAVAIIQYQTGAYGLHPAINGLPGWLRRRVPGLPVTDHARPARAVPVSQSRAAAPRASTGC